MTDKPGRVLTYERWLSTQRLRSSQTPCFRIGINMFKEIFNSPLPKVY